MTKYFLVGLMLCSSVAWGLCGHEKGDVTVIYLTQAELDSLNSGGAVHILSNPKHTQIHPPIEVVAKELSKMKYSFRFNIDYLQAEYDCLNKRRGNDVKRP